MVAGKYRVERVLGVGGMGAVASAVHVDLGQRVAIKVMLPELAKSAEFTARFLREARAAASVQSERVAKVFDVGKADDGTLYMIMELLEGVDLHKLQKDRGDVLPIEEAAGYVLEACEAIAAAHALGIVHRDLKPSNLFLAQRPGAPPIVKVLDFGISKSLDPGDDAGPTLTTTESVLGSPYYMSPEQIRSPKKVDRRTDIFSLGLILYKLLTGNLPFESDSVGEHLVMATVEPPMPLRLRRPDAPVELEAVVLRCLEKDPNRRYADVGQLAAALAPFSPPASRVVLDRISALLGPTSVASPLPLRSIDRPPPTGATPPPALANEVATLTTAASFVARSRKTSLPPAAGARRPWLVAVLAAAVSSGTVVAMNRLGPRLGGNARPPEGLTSQAPAAVPPESPPPAASITVEWRIDPADAKLTIDGKEVQGSSIRLARSDETHTLVASAAGFVPMNRAFSGRADLMLSLALEREREKREATPAPPTARPRAPAKAVSTASTQETPPPAPVLSPPTQDAPNKPKGPIETTL
jgi:serine/threonine-protein kinase